ncbi:MAG: hypothetical protein AAFV80_20710 [Bacteroidota bacterium]
MDTEQVAFINGEIEISHLNFHSYTTAIEQTVQDNLGYWRDHYPWFQQYANNTLTAESIAYFVESPDYKNRVAYFYLAVYEGYLLSVQEFATKLAAWKTTYAAFKPTE